MARLFVLVTAMAVLAMAVDAGHLDDDSWDSFVAHNERCDNRIIKECCGSSTDAMNCIQRLRNTVSRGDGGKGMYIEAIGSMRHRLLLIYKSYPEMDDLYLRRRLDAIYDECWKQGGRLCQF